ncbi:leucine-rich repeat protein [Ruminococcus sp.]|uniref:leucine-rich repeat protein n=1 Tax=Ruminococcus sp. TaxID=41978 RepID=UPI0025D6AC2C|nr:leucine-rich repeat protein [Ruminococcus sp.]MBQ8966190.1 leucine-rich repeat protein [Ruminococcus sp.]
MYKRKIIAVMAAAVMSCSVIGAENLGAFAEEMSPAAEAAAEGAYEYALLEDGTAEITKYTASGEGIVSIPSEIGGKKVTVIGSRAFSSADITEVIIPDTVTVLGDHAFFFCRKLVRVDIPDSVTTIGNSCFWGDDELLSADLPDSVTHMDGLVFARCAKLRTIRLPSGLEEIPGYTFENCTSLEKVQIPDTVKKIGGLAFCGCTSLRSLDIPAQAVPADNSVGVYADFKPDGTYTLEKIDGFTMYVYKESPAEKYAVDNGIAYNYAESAPVTLKGDISGDGDINVTDLSALAAHVKSIRALSSTALEAADVNSDGEVDVTDLTKLAAHVKGIKPL